MKKLLIITIRILAWILAVALALLLVVIVLIQTPPIKQKIARVAEKQAANYIDGGLTIGKLEGNLWNHLQLNHVSLSQNSDTIASIETIDLTYDLWPLLKHQVQINTFELINPRLKLIQLKDSSWNVEHLVMEQNTPADTADSTSDMTWAFNLQKLNLQNGSAQFLSSDRIIPEQLNGLYIELGAFYSEHLQELNLQHFKFQTAKPNFVLNQLTFHLKHSDEITELNNFVLETAKNQIDAEATYTDEKAETSSLDLQTKPLNTDEFSFFLPDLKFKVKPQIKWKAKFKNEQLSSTIILTNEEQNIDITIKADNLSSWVRQPDSTELTYQIEIDLDKVKLDEWSGLADLNYILAGNINLDGKGTDPKKLQADLTADFFDSNIAGYLLKKLTVTTNYQAGNLKTNLSMVAAFGELTANSNLRDLFGTPKYKATLKSEHLNLGPLMNNDSLTSNINLRLDAEGSSFDPKILQAKATLVLQPSNFMEIPIDTAYADLAYANEELIIENLNIRNASVKVGAKGKYSLTGITGLNLNGEISSLEAFKSFLPEAIIKTSGEFNAQLSGPSDSLKIDSQLNLRDTKYDDFQIENAAITANGFVSSSIHFNTEIKAENFKSSFIELDSINLKSELFPDSLELQASITNSDLNSQLTTSLNWKDQITVYLGTWDIGILNQKWALESPSTFTIDSSGYKIDQFKLSSLGQQSISMTGEISLKGEENFKLNISKIDIGALLQTLEVDQGVSGLLSLDLQLRGTAQAPVIESDFKIDSAAYNDFNFKKAEGEISYASNLLTLNSELSLQRQGQFLAKGEIPYKLNLETLQTSFDQDNAVDASVRIVDLPLALIRSAINAKEVNGLINGEVKVNGSVKEPNPTGELRLKDGKIKIPEFGIDYRDIQFATTFDNDIIRLDTLGISSEDGTITGGGNVFFDSEFYKGQINKSTIKLKFNKFNPINQKQINMQLSGDASLNGEKDSVIFDGNLEIPQSEIYLPAVLNLMGKVYTAEIPKSILVQELEKLQNNEDSIPTPQKTIELQDSIRSAYFDNLTGIVKIKIPRNTWVKNLNLRLELSGDLELMKHREFVELFGSVNIIRGQYELFGRTFVVSEGVITFEGGEEINPNINFIASYTIKSRNSASRTLKLFVEGEAMDPRISFTLDDQSISEGDALSYIVFGKSLNELSATEQDNVSGSSQEAMAKSAAASILASQLTKILGKNLNVDYIKINSEDDFDNGSLEVGKYITNDLFLSYEQQFGATSDHDLSRYEVKLEYEILRFLFLQLNNSTNDSGFDIIFKIDAD
ncbi:translocation/assembly module TamB domain-containing protein [Mangrovibacterium lignilyticum]|uniref:translocation/assembly module TamB domain-containing protein n=1 Tax=Mangrovibacterium lignilyticum TaxID=2668052 RepID=UPI0013D18A54|nr:translocation/assembly module TamB domain-containing protein [Mangrovibacterium lignilyticum]